MGEKNLLVKAEGEDRMLFDEVIEEKIEGLHNQKVNTRKAVRGVILEDEKILLIHCNLGDYKFPGGGIKRQEDHESALIREVKEEAGYTVSEVVSQIGKMTEIGPDKFEENALFEMKSYYYMCKVLNIKGQQNLDDYEHELEFKPVWIRVKDAISCNEKLLESHDRKINDWVYRETLVLKKLLAHLNK